MLVPSWRSNICWRRRSFSRMRWICNDTVGGNRRRNGMSSGAAWEQSLWEKRARNNNLRVLPRLPTFQYGKRCGLAHHVMNLSFRLAHGVVVPFFLEAQLQHLGSDGQPLLSLVCRSCCGSFLGFGNEWTDRAQAELFIQPEMEPPMIIISSRYVWQRVCRTVPFPRGQSRAQWASHSNYHIQKSQPIGGNNFRSQRASRLIQLPCSKIQPIGSLNNYHAHLI